MNMRPFQIVVIAVFVVLALGGLLLFATYKGVGGSKPVGDVIIWGTLPEGAVSVAIDDLKQSHQEFGKVTYVERDAATFDASLVDALASGTGPDLIITDSERLFSEENKLNIIPFATLPERTFRDSYLPLFSVFQTTGGVYGIPLAVDPLVLYYNRTTLASANISQPPQTWEGVVGSAPRLTVKTNAGVIAKSAIPFGTYENIPHARAIISLILLQSGVGMNDTSSGSLRTSLTSGGDTFNISPGESAISFYTQFADPAKVVYTWNRSKVDGRQSFLAGDSAFYVGFASEHALLTDANPNLDFDMALIPQPETSQVKTDYAIGYAFAFPKGAHNPAGAYRVAVALAAKDKAPLIVQKLSMAPAMRSLMAAPSGDLYAPIIYPLALISKSWLSPAPAVTDRIFAGMINDIVSGRSSVREALVTADESLTAALQ
ncbi:MAG: hypothetical protein JWL82_366 [Parcubacteria group bacterium]|nr:hypothetical protein [Parcubacteria group bacterium]